jgi:hypothetical protein
MKAHHVTFVQVAATTQTNVLMRIATNAHMALVQTVAIEILAVNIVLAVSQASQKIILALNHVATIATVMAIDLNAVTLLTVTAKVIETAIVQPAKMIIAATNLGLAHALKIATTVAKTVGNTKVVANQSTVNVVPAITLNSIRMTP